ncbi:pre-peptidase C-terminal domain-containing protein [Aliikangiella sp. G2MR2-5]|uniref:pre-peptidase C-terminal domain-containing protein n=1 Tax=Aliikangiella sp. G2MR2-5 TaxID=2788943 RepID=UPI0027392037|nr:pre-peptidase C-terminal domain-containing protein [Aliikangiella sp. G2MR2-5]
MKVKMTTKLFKKSIAASLILSACTVGAASAEQRYIIQFKDAWDGNTTPMSLMTNEQIQARAQNNAQHVKSFGAKVKRNLMLSNAVAAELSLKQLSDLEASGKVLFIEQDPKRFLIPTMESSDPVPMAESAPYGIGLVQADQVSDANTANRKVCITDTGYTPNHEDLRPYTASNIDGDDNDGNGNDTGNWYNDGHGHGTHVAGTIAGIGGNGVGVVGVNPSNLLNLHIVKVFNDSGSWAYGSDLVAAVNQCVSAGANVISMSLGGGQSSTAESNAFENALSNGVLSIAASGNSGSSSGNDAFSYPASYDAVVSVGALNSSKQIANFSQKNSQVELSAPGVSVRSTIPNNQYASWDGTSMATPHVSGVAALVWSHYTDCTATQIRKALNDSAEDLGSSGRDQSYGYGLVQAKAAVDYLAQYGCEGNPDGGGGGGGTDPVELTNGQAVSSLSGAQGDELEFFIDVPAGATDLSFAMSGGSGDADLYVKFDAAPTTSSYDCRPYKSGNSETCSFATPSTGRYHVMIRGYSSFSGVSLTASFTEDNGGGGGGDGQLSNGVAETNLSGAQGEELAYYIDVPAGASNLSFVTAGGSGDADLYVRFGAAPTTSTYDCRPYKSGNNENCDFASPGEGRYYVMIRGYSAFSGMSLTASYDENGGGGGAGSINEGNLSASSGNWNYFTIEVPAGMATLDLNITGGSGDADLYVKQGSQVTTSNYDCRPYKWGNEESCSFTNPAAGTWYIGVRAYNSYSGVTLSGNWQ